VTLVAWSAGENHYGFFALAGSGQGESRTHDTRIFSPLLYCLSYLSVAPCCGSETYQYTSLSRIVNPALRNAKARGIIGLGESSDGGGSLDNTVINPL
jgi:hypothetical protein